MKLFERIIRRLKGPPTDRPAGLASTQDLNEQKEKPIRLPAHRQAINALYAERVGEISVTESDLFRLVNYGHDGQFDYDLYKSIQTIANKGKLGAVFASEANIQYLCARLEEMIPQVRFVLCHGTRNGTEQRWFAQYLSKSVRVLGTEISDAADQFPDTIQWDFHEIKEEWISAADVIYSNSWDHAYDPEKMFRNWLKCLTVGGVMVIEWTTGHARSVVNAMDPLGMDLDDLLKFLSREEMGQTFDPPVLMQQELPDKRLDRAFVLVQRRR